MRELFVYYRVPRASAAAVREQVQQLQSRLRATVPHLRARLLQRPDSDDAEQTTFMETYAIEPAQAAGIDLTLQARIEAAAARDIRGIVGTRHVEVFLACESG